MYYQAGSQPPTTHPTQTTYPTITQRRQISSYLNSPSTLFHKKTNDSGATELIGTPHFQGTLTALLRWTKVKFRKPVVPGDTLVMEVEVKKFREKVRNGS